MIDIKQQLEWLLQNPQVTKRIAICVECDKFYKPTKQCQECLCIVSLKALVPRTKCPLGKW
jgi:hypothetical protein